MADLQRSPYKSACPSPLSHLELLLSHILLSRVQTSSQEVAPNLPHRLGEISCYISFRWHAVTNHYAHLISINTSTTSYHHPHQECDHSQFPNAFGAQTSSCSTISRKLSRSMWSSLTLRFKCMCMDHVWESWRKTVLFQLDCSQFDSHVWFPQHFNNLSLSLEKVFFSQMLPKKLSYHC